MKLTLLVLLNMANLFVFWIMWRGFYINGEMDIFIGMLVYYFVVTCLSLVFFFLRSSKVLLRFSKFGSFPNGIDREKFINLSMLVGAYAMGAVYLIVAGVMYLINGTIDIWASGLVT